jgi:hypothetical protein
LPLEEKDMSRSVRWQLLVLVLGVLALVVTFAASTNVLASPPSSPQTPEEKKPRRQAEFPHHGETEYERSVIRMPVRFGGDKKPREIVELTAFMKLEREPAVRNTIGYRQFEFTIREWELFGYSEALGGHVSFAASQDVVQPRRPPLSGRALLLALGLALAGPLPDAAQVAQGAGKGSVSLDDLSWLAGSWRGEIQGAKAATRFETHYTAPQGGVILSISKAFRPDGKLAWFEFERFESQDGVLRVTPYPGGKASVSFTLVEYDAAAKKAVFANPEHDYPNRITYQRVAEDRLRFVVAGDKQGSPVMEFTLSPMP